MARLIRTDVYVDMACNMATYKTDGSIIVKKLNIGDIVEGLRYVKDKKVVTVSGKIKQFVITPKASSSVIKDTFAEDVRVNSIIIDASEKYKAKTVTVPAMEIVEFAGVEDVKMVRVYMSMTFEMNLTYSNGIVQHQSLQVGDILDNMVIMGAQPGQPDITGRFEVATFSYKPNNAANAVNNSITVTTVNLKGEDGKIVSYDYNRFISFEEIITEPVDSVEEIVALLAGDYKYFDLTVNQDMEYSEPIEIPEGKEVILNLGESAIITPEGTDIYTIDNKGKLTLIGGKIESRGVNNDGEMVINGTEITTRNDATIGGGAIINNGDLVIEDVVARTQYVGSTSDPKGPACMRNFGTVTIKKGTFESGSKRTYCIISGDGDVQIGEDAVVTVNGVHGGIAIDGGTATINAGTYVSEEFYGLYVSNDDLTADVVVNGGKFDGANYAVWCGSDDNEHVDSIVQIHGGVFDHPLKDQSNVAPGAGISVDGGKFKQAVEAAYIAEGYICTADPGEDGYYEVVKALEPSEEPEPESPEDVPVVEPEISGEDSPTVNGDTLEEETGEF